MVKSNPDINYIIYTDASTEDWGTHENNQTINKRQ